MVVQEGKLRTTKRRLGLVVEGSPAPAVPQSGADIISCPNRHDVGRVTGELGSGACLPQYLETGLSPLQLAQASLHGSLAAGGRLLVLGREGVGERKRPVSRLSVDGQGG